MTDWLPERRLSCPFCGEQITLVVDTSGGSQSYVEDCQVCCQPMQITVEIDDGQLQTIRADR
jgi:transcription elongation factor Elf1